MATDKNIVSNRQVVSHLILKNVECIFGNFFNFFINMKGPVPDVLKNLEGR